MTREEWNERIKEVYDSLTAEQFNTLLNNSKKMIRNLIGAGRIDRVDLGNDKWTWEFDDDNHKFSYQVFVTVEKSRRLSFKQFKMLSAFSKTDWLTIDKEDEVEYKQF